MELGIVVLILVALALGVKRHFDTKDAVSEAQFRKTLDLMFTHLDRQLDTIRAKRQIYHDSYHDSQKQSESN